MTTPRAEQKTPDEEKLVNEITRLLDGVLKLPLIDPNTLVENKGTLERACYLAQLLKQHNSDLGTKFWKIASHSPLITPNNKDLLLLLFNRALQLYPDEIGQANCHGRLFDVYANNNKKDEAIIHIVHFLKIFKGQFTVEDGYATDQCGRVMRLRKLGEPGLAIAYLDFFDQKSKAFSLLLPHAAKENDWEFVKYLLDKYRSVIDIEASIVDYMGITRNDDNSEAKNSMSVKTLFYSARARNKNITKYLMLLGANRSYDPLLSNFSLIKGDIAFVNLCYQELLDFAKIKALFFENRNSSTFLFQEFKINARKTAPKNSSPEYLKDLDKRGSDEIAVDFPTPLRHKILFFAMDSDLEGIPESILLACSLVTKAETNPKIAALAIREYRDNFDESMTPVTSKDKRRLTCQILDEKFGGDEPRNVYRRLIRYNFGFMARQQISLTERNIKNLLSSMETAIKNLVDSAAEKAKLDYKNVPVTLLNKTYHSVQLQLISYFSAKEYSGLWSQKDVMEQCAVKLAECLNTLPAHFYGYPLSDRMIMLTEGIKKHMVPVLDEAVAKKTSSEKDHLLTRLQA